jgi:hypothetical protein
MLALSAVCVERPGLKISPQLGQGFSDKSALLAQKHLRLQKRLSAPWSLVALNTLPHSSHVKSNLFAVVCATSAQVLPQYIVLAKLGERENSVLHIGHVLTT